MDNINKMHPTIKFAADWSKLLKNFLDVTVSIAEGIIETDLHVNLLTASNAFCQSFCHPF